MKALIIDGPAKGQLYKMPTDTTQTFTMVQAQDHIEPSMSHLITEDLRYPLYHVTLYHVYEAQFLGRTIRLASIHLTKDEISEEAAFEAIVSDQAKEATSWTW